METLYSTIISKFDDEGRKWLKEIISWLVVKSLDLAELREVVEWSLQDSLPGFQNFVEAECGST